MPTLVNSLPDRSFAKDVFLGVSEHKFGNFSTLIEFWPRKGHPALNAVLINACNSEPTIATLCCPLDVWSSLCGRTIKTGQLYILVVLLLLYCSDSV